MEIQEQEQWERVLANKQIYFLKRNMAKASRSRKNRHTRKVRKGSRKMRGGMTREEEEAIKLRQFLMDAIEEEDIDTLKIFIEQQQYRAILQEGLMCLENKNKLLEE